MKMELRSFTKETLVDDPQTAAQAAHSLRQKRSNDKYAFRKAAYRLSRHVDHMIAWAKDD